MEHRGNRVPGVGERARRVEERHCLLPPALSRARVRNRDLKALKTESSERRWGRASGETA